MSYPPVPHHAVRRQRDASFYVEKGASNLAFLERENRGSGLNFLIRAGPGLTAIAAGRATHAAQRFAEQDGDARADVTFGPLGGGGAVGAGFRV